MNTQVVPAVKQEKHCVMFDIYKKKFALPSQHMLSAILMHDNSTRKCEGLRRSARSYKRQEVASILKVAVLTRCTVSVAFDIENSLRGLVAVHTQHVTWREEVLDLCGGERFRENVRIVLAGVHSSQRCLCHVQEIDVYLRRFPRVPKFRAASTFDSQAE